uniref:Uncharacterized protein n=1 Tax=Vitis vinifera TaxID=29760 RepID=F6GZL1_VITVI
MPLCRNKQHDPEKAVEKTCSRSLDMVDVFSLSTTNNTSTSLPKQFLPGLNVNSA